MALGLTLSTLLGIAVAWSIASLRRAAIVAFAAGTVLPLLLLLL